MSTKKLLVIDGSAVLHRAFHALPPFTSPDGTPTNAVFGFIKMLMSLIAQVHPEYLVVCFDSPTPTFRKLLLPTYQAQRPKTPDEYVVQIPLTQAFLDKAHIANYFMAGFEADDVIGTLVARAKKEDAEIQVSVVTGDKDILQLVDDRTTILMPKSGVGNIAFMDAPAVKKRLGIEPHQIIDYKALVGDPSDNYGGVRGIGPKKAIDLLTKYKTLSELYNHLADLDNRTRTLLTEHKKDALLSQELATIKCDLDLPIMLSSLAYVPHVASPELAAYLDKLGLQSIKQQLLRVHDTHEREKTAMAKRKKAADDSQLSMF